MIKYELITNIKKLVLKIVKVLNEIPVVLNDLIQ